jgi:hypothetical protein
MKIADMTDLIIQSRNDDHRGGWIVTLPNGHIVFSADLKASCIDFVSGWRNAERHILKSQ